MCKKRESINKNAHNKALFLVNNSSNNAYMPTPHTHSRLDANTHTHTYADTQTCRHLHRFLRRNIYIQAHINHDTPTHGCIHTKQRASYSHSFCQHWTNTPSRPCLSFLPSFFSPSLPVFTFPLCSFWVTFSTTYSYAGARSSTVWWEQSRPSLDLLFVQTSRRLLLSMSSMPSPLFLYIIFSV